MAGDSGALHMCKSSIDNLDALVMIYKNWPDDLRARCVSPRGNVAQYSNTKADLLEAHEDEIEMLDCLKRNSISLASSCNN